MGTGGVVTIGQLRQLRQRFDLVKIGQIWRDRDKRASSGNRHVRIVCGAVKNGHPAYICVRVYKDSGGWQVGTAELRTTMLERTLRGRFELVSDV